MRALAITLLASGLLTACASPKIDLAVAGLGPDKAAGAYRLAAPIDPDAPEDKTVLPQVEARLKANGLTRALGAAPYVLELAVTQRPIAVASAPGLAPAVAAGPAKAAPAADWMSPPGKHLWWVSKPESICQLQIRLVDAKTGQEAYWVRAALQVATPDCTAITPRLADVALSKVPLPSGDSQIP